MKKFTLLMMAALLILASCSDGPADDWMRGKVWEGLVDVEGIEDKVHVEIEIDMKGKVVLKDSGVPEDANISYISKGNKVLMDIEYTVDGQDVSGTYIFERISEEECRMTLDAETPGGRIKVSGTLTGHRI